MRKALLTATLATAFLASPAVAQEVGPSAGDWELQLAGSGTSGDGFDDDSDTRWEAYADYRKISLRVAGAIEDAVNAYARLDSAHQEGAQIQPELAAEARARILGAVMKLMPELEEDRETVDLYDEILTRWEHGEEPEDDSSPGYIEAINQTRLKDESPSWLFQLVLDIRQAGWELGYLQAGRKRDAGDGDPVEKESDSMVED